MKRLRRCDRADRIAGAIIFAAVIAAAHIIYWWITGDFKVSLWRGE